MNKLYGINGYFFMKQNVNTIRLFLLHTTLPTLILPMRLMLSFSKFIKALKKKWWGVWGGCVKVNPLSSGKGFKGLLR